MASKETFGCRPLVEGSFCGEYDREIDANVGLVLDHLDYGMAAKAVSDADEKRKAEAAAVLQRAVESRVRAAERLERQIAGLKRELADLERLRDAESVERHKVAAGDPDAVKALVRDPSLDTLAKRLDSKECE